jgi:CheY-like chemotaxis protein
MALRIVVVDDDKATATSLADSLRLLGHQVIVSLGPRGALAQLNRLVPDMVFLDMNMPGIDGLEICRYLRRDPKTARVPVVIVSANDEQGYKEAARKAGANYYIVKPAMIEDLETAIGYLTAITARSHPL